MKENNNNLPEKEKAITVRGIQVTDQLSFSDIKTQMSKSKFSIVGLRKEPFMITMPATVVTDMLKELYVHIIDSCPFYMNIQNNMNHSFSMYVTNGSMKATAGCIYRELEDAGEKFKKITFDCEYHNPTTELTTHMYSVNNGVFTFVLTECPNQKIGSGGLICLKKDAKLSSELKVAKAELSSMYGECCVETNKMPKAKWMHEIFEIYKTLLHRAFKLGQKREEITIFMKQSEEFLLDIPIVNKTYTIAGEKYDGSLDSFTRLFAKMSELENKINDTGYDFVQYVNIVRLKDLYKNRVQTVMEIQDDMVDLQKYGKPRDFFKAVMIDAGISADKLDLTYDAFIAAKTNETE